MKLPQRPVQHNLEEISKRFFQSQLPVNWTTDKPSNDYGIDLVVNIFDGTNASPYQFLVQLKSSQAMSAFDSEKIPLNISTYNYLRFQLHVAIVVKYVLEDNEAYWLRLVDIPKPNQNKKSFTVSIPRKNKLSCINWVDFENYIRKIVDLKLSVTDVISLEKK